MELSAAEIRRAVQAALAEDIGSGDATTLATVPETATARAVMRAREPLVGALLVLRRRRLDRCRLRLRRRISPKPLSANFLPQSKLNDWPKTAGASTAAKFC